MTEKNHNNFKTIALSIVLIFSLRMKAYLFILTYLLLIILVITALKTVKQ